MLLPKILSTSEPIHGGRASQVRIGASLLKSMDQILMNGLRHILALLLGAMATLIFANVLMRYITGGSLVWAEEVARYLMIWLTLLGSGLVLRTGGHIAIDNLQDALPEFSARILRGLILASLVFCAISMIVLGVQYMLRSTQQITASTQVPFAVIYAAMPVGGLILLWCCFFMAPSYVLQRKFDAEPANELHQEGVQI